MVGNAFFQSSTLGMMSQAYALNTIGKNVANVNTGGYKRTDTQFETVLSKTLDKNVSDIGGIRPKDYQIIDSQGVIQSSERDLDLAIVGTGFFQVSTNFAQTGETLYTRDGSFRTAAVNQISVPGTGFTINDSPAFDSNGVQIHPVSGTDAYLVDKNGYYVLGWSAESDGTFTNTGALSPLRIDVNAFTSTFTPSSTSRLHLNLPSTTEIVADHASTVLAADGGTNNENLITYTAEIVDSNGKKQTARINMSKSADNTWDFSATTSRASTQQTDTIMLAGTVEAGDTYSTTVNGTTVSYTTSATDTTINNIRDGLLAAINADAAITALVTATAGNTGGEITLTALATTPSFTATATAANGANTAQADTVTITGTVVAGEQYKISVDGNTVTYTVKGTEADLAAVRTGIIAAINADPIVGALVTAAPGALAGEITMTALTATAPFTSATAASVISSNTAANATTTPNGVGIAQVDTVTITAANTPGETYAINVDGNVVSYTVTGLEGGLTGIRSALRAAINADATVGPLVTAADGVAGGEITLTAAAAGTPFTTTVSTPPDTATNTTSVATTTPQVTTIANNTVATATKTSSQISAISTVQFTPLGVVAGTPPDPLAFTLNFADGGTATISMDISDMTQFGSGFTPYSFDHNGLAAAQMFRTQFDSAGHVIGTFDDGTQRKIYKIPLAVFSNPNGLEMKNGMVFAETDVSGAPSTFAADVTSIASFNPYSVELSNVDLATEFSRMIMVQNAYNSNATVFKTVDEMTMVARDLKA